MSEQTCSERIDSHAQSRVDDFRTLTAAAGVYDDDDLSAIGYLADKLEALGVEGETADDVNESATERIYEYPLAVTRLMVHRIDLSTGGPGDWLEVFSDDDNDITRITYHFVDWFDDAAKNLEGSDFEHAEAFARHLIDFDCLS